MEHGKQYRIRKENTFKPLTELLMFVYCWLFAKDKARASGPDEKRDREREDGGGGETGFSDEPTDCP